MYSRRADDRVGLAARSLCVVGVLAVALGLSATPASASKSRSLLGSFCEPAGIGTPPCSPAFGSPDALAVDGAGGDVLVVDQAGGGARISRYKPNGEADPFSALGTNSIDGKGPGGDETPQNGLSFKEGAEIELAVDSSGGATEGDIYITQVGQHLIDIFAGNGNYLGQLTKYKKGPKAEGAEEPLGEACGVAVNSSGAVYVGDYDNGVHKYVPSSAPATNADSKANFTTVQHPCALAAGAGPSAGSIFAVKYVGPVYKLDSSSGAIAYGEEPILEGNNTTMWNKTVAVNGESGDVLVAQNKQVIELNASRSTGAGRIGPPTEVPATVEGIGAEAGGKLYVAQASNPNLAVFGAPEREAPVIEAEWTVSASFEEATVKARFGLEEEETTYHVEYLSQAEFEANGDSFAGPHSPTDVPVPDAGVGTAETVTVSLSGLSSGTTYRWRFVASNPAGTTEGPDRTLATHSRAGGGACPNQSLREGPGAQLPDCRGYEMVSPVDKNGGDVNAFIYEGFYQTGGLEEYEGIDQATPGGAKLTYTASTAFGEPLSSPLVSQYLAVRHQGAGGAGEWTSEGISAPERGGNITVPEKNEYKAFSPDLGTAWLEPEAGNPLAPCATEGYINLYRVTLSSPATYTATCSSAPAPPECVAEPKPPEACWLFPQIQGYSADQSQAVFRVNDPLPTAPGSPEAAPLGRDDGGFQVYEWDEEGGLRLVSVLPDGGAYPGTSSAGTESEGGQAPRVAHAGNFDTVEHAMSADGSRVYWSTMSSSTESSPAAPPGPGRIFIRLNADKPQSAFAAPGGAASGAAGSNGGGLSAGSTAVTKLIAAAGTATLSNGSNELSALVTTVGEFVAGQPIEGNGIPAGTTITTASATTLTLSAAATKSKAKVEISSKGPQPFAVGQRIVGAGIPAQTTIAAVGPGTLTLSAAATKSTPLGLSTALSAFSECSEAEAACTLPVSEAVSEGAAKFWDATPSGSEALFSFFEGPEAGSLYRYDLGGEEATLIAKKSEGVLGASEDLSRIYFASEELCGGGNDEGKSPSKGRPNVYLYQPGESCAEGTMTFLGTLVPGDISTGSFEQEFPSPVASVPRFHVARVSANGLHLAFVSAARLGAYDNADAASGQADREVYLYDASANEGKGGLLCASCNPSGARPAGVNLEKEGSVWTAAWINSYQYQLYGRRMLSEDGKRLFFNSYDALTPRDTNGTEDVYEWEALGAGPPEAKCAASNPDYSAQDGGCVSLISAGTSPRESEFVDASTDGSDVFFRTESSLDPRDPGLVDIYDARVGGGTAPPPSAPAACEGEACQSPPGAPGDATPASSAFHGPGNAREAKPSRCPKGKRKVRNHGKTRCVQKHKRQAKKRKRGAAR